MSSSKIKYDIYSQKGEKVGQVELNPAVFGVDINDEVVSQVAVAQRANNRPVVAHTKDRSEVRGGGRKPWRQKGTGRARHGSIRSPLWIGGGVTFGPRNERNYKKKINKKMKLKALAMVLSDKVKHKNLLILDNFNLPEAKTKKMVEMVNRLPLDKKSLLLALPELPTAVKLSARNLNFLKLINVKDLNVLDILSSRYLVTTKSGLEIMENHFFNKVKK